MPLTHLLLALLVVVVWGSNFVVIRLGLDAFPPFLFAALRFGATALPALLFIARPSVPWRYLVGYGVVLGVGQFGLLFLAMRADISPGLASLVVQTQAFFTIALAMWLRGERPAWLQLPALALTLAGLAWIASHAMGNAIGQGAQGATLLGLMTVLGAALAWALANTIARGAPKHDALGFTVWSAGFSVPPLLLLSAWLDAGGAAAWPQAFAQADGWAWLAVVWQAAGNTLFAYSAWNWLLARHAAATVAPLSLMVPVVGMAASAYWLAEPLPMWKWGAGLLVLAGLAWNIIATRQSGMALRPKR